LRLEQRTELRLVAWASRIEHEPFRDPDRRSQRRGRG
jgi:hypothetical protein